ncbi:MAG TPA: cysteine desulfurase family protein [Nitrososphaerales archaeon]|jgi:cysteine desulfurase|nr:cysteine desulfurase family protein [Nitrososphaerales archaeon]|tara:strand:- start:5896 stop:7071 length:1176 start_codon:yes stop_codon:yes gene_type:complete
MRSIYADNAATTPLDPRVLEAMMPYLTTKYGNAESLNTLGMEAKKALDESRATLAKFINAENQEIIFTGSATEANNMVLKCHAFQQGVNKVHIAISTIEHPCIHNPASWLKKNGSSITFIPVDSEGLLDFEYLEKVLKAGVTLVSVIHGNNEIGTIQDIKKIGKLCHEHDAYFHTDAAQTFGKIPIDVKTMNIDIMTMNAHKTYGPKGVGALYLNKDVKMEPYLHGGEHEFGLRAGTHNIPGVVGFAKTVDLREKEMFEEAKKLTILRDRLIKGVLEIDETYLNGHPKKRLANNINIRFLYIEGESLVLKLDMEGIATSSRSACVSRTEEASRILLALGIDPIEVRGPLRISLGKNNTEEDIDYILEVLPHSVQQLRRMSPLSPKKFRKEN